MKHTTKILAAALIAISAQANQAQAQSLIKGNEAKNIPGDWVCTTSITEPNMTNFIVEKTNYLANGTAKGNATFELTLNNGDALPMQVETTSQWRYDAAEQRMFETIRTIKVAYDPKSPLATLGALQQQHYESLIGRENSAFVVRINDKEWIMLGGDVNKKPVPINCKR
jgi:plasmid maintenance system killer protein